jgi:signal transduction histidine kinase
MTIRTRLFLGVGALVLALVGVQVWLQARQLQAIERGLGEVATTVGSALLTGPAAPILWHVEEEHRGAQGKVGFEWRMDEKLEKQEVSGDRDGSSSSHVVVVPPLQGVTGPHLPTPGGEGVTADRRLKELTEKQSKTAEEIARMRREVRRQLREKKVQMEVVREARNRFLVVRGVPGGEEQIELPVSPTVGTVRRNMRQGLLASALLLLVGLAGAAVLAHRVTRPLRALSGGVEALGRGELGAQVPVTGSGEVAEVQRAFNLMSSRLYRLEGEKQRWQEREQLAQLGQLAHGLAHTLRNPLNTLGLAVEELSGGEDGERQRLATTARAQIHRIDRWLRSFLALGAGEAAAPEVCDATGIVQEVVLEAIQAGGRVSLNVPPEQVPVCVVPQALRAAVANLVENATQAAGDGSPVEVETACQEHEAVITVADRGPGLPEEVRSRLFSPHVTTKVEGSGMGLFLARQLVVGLHGGRLAVRDREGGGTVAEIRLPLGLQARDADPWEVEGAS